MAIAVIHDLTGVGRCALSVILPTLSAMGYQACPAATALLSTHPHFPGYVYQPQTETVQAILAHWTALDICFEAVYVGFLTASAAPAVLDFVQRQKQQGAVVMADPVMGDGGALYRFFDQDMPDYWRDLLTQADICTPNITEACALLHHTYADIVTQQDTKSIIAKLQILGPRHVVITSCHDGQEWYNCADDGNVYPYQAVLEGYPGTGDLFAAVLLGTYLQHGWNAAVSKATAFTTYVVWKTYQKSTPPREGLCFEPHLGELCDISLPLSHK